MSSVFFSITVSLDGSMAPEWHSDEQRFRQWMQLQDYYFASVSPGATSSSRLSASIAVSDIQKAIAFYEGKLHLRVLQSGPSAHIADGSRIDRCGGDTALHVYQSDTAGKSQATLPIWYVDDIDRVVDELTAAGVEFASYDAFEADAKGIAARAGGGRIAWFEDPDGNTFALEADV